MIKKALFFLLGLSSTLFGTTIHYTDQGSPDYERMNMDMQEEIEQGYERLKQKMAPINKYEEDCVRSLGEHIGYGRLMQLAEQIWCKKAKEKGLDGSEHTVGCCAWFLVDCPHLGLEEENNYKCDWCCGSGRVTKKVLEVMKEVENGKIE
jgi:hypothetical protein